MREEFRQGVSDGLREKWHDNGQLSEQIEMKAGQPDGIAWAYYPSGFLKAETTVLKGQVFERKSWKDGERKNP